MANYLKLKTTEEPTVFNKEMAIGTLLFPVVGTVIGGYVGKSRMQAEKVDGRLVSDEPSFWNKDTLLGTLVGGNVGYIAGLAVAAAMAVSTGGISIAVAEMVAAAGAAGGMLMGGAVGGKMGQSRQHSEFNQAKQQVVEREMARIGRSVLEQEVSHGKGHSHVAALENDRAQLHEHHR